MTALLDDFVERARGVSIADAAVMLGLRISPRSTEHPQPCLACGGKDCFSFNTQKNLWNCRSGDDGGRDAIGMAAHIGGLDTKDRAQFLEACAMALGEDVPDATQIESSQQRTERLEKLEQRRVENAKRQAEREAGENSFRDSERRKARGIFEAANQYRQEGCVVRAYLQQRLAYRSVHASIHLHLRASTSQTYWHGFDERGHPIDHYTGPAMIGCFVDVDQNIIGCHITWIDLSNGPKFRPDLRVDDKGKPLPTKKMRGTKKGGLIPVAGSLNAERWVVGEGIETVIAVAWCEDFRTDTFYAAAGDKGNLTGPATRAGSLKHPTRTKADKNGKQRPVRVPAPYPDPARAEQAFPIASHVRECVLLGENDKDDFSIKADMARGIARVALIAPQCRATCAWPPPGHGDFCDFVRAGST